MMHASNVFAKLNYTTTVILLGVFFLFNLSATTKQPPKYKTRYVVIVVIDGPRYSETWGDSSHRYIPHMAKDMAKEGVVFRQFYNDGYTTTNSGHAAICTGYKQPLENTKGSQLPKHPSFFQYYLQKHPEDSAKVWVITTKDKLSILNNCENTGWNNKFQAKSDCGKHGNGSGYREDSTTFKNVMDKLKNNQAHLLLVNFKEPDHSGHANRWNDYLKGITHSDSLAWEIWKQIQSNPYYKNKTTLFITNDHGRHLDGWKDGFVSHGDSCEGCRHINLFAAGPDFRKNFISDSPEIQVNITATVTELLHLSMENSQGKVIKDCFEKK